MTAPRVWVGGPAAFVDRWEWDGRWYFMSSDCMIEDKVIFSTSVDRPTVSPADIDSLQTCKVVDW